MRDQAEVNGIRGEYIAVMIDIEDYLDRFMINFFGISPQLRLAFATWVLGHMTTASRIETLSKIANVIDMPEEHTSVIAELRRANDRRNNLAQQVEADARGNLGDLVFKTMIPRNVRLSEAPSYAVPVLTYDPASKGAVAYRDLAEELLRKHNKLQSEGALL